MGLPYTEVGLFHTGSGRLSNNSIVIADSAGRIDGLQCISASTTPNVGHWIATNGQNITFTTGDPFDVTIGGQNNPGNLEIAIVPGESLGGLDEGVYACVIPDETGVEQTIHVGIYLNNFNSKCMHEYTPKCINAILYACSYQFVAAI